MTDARETELEPTLPEIIGLVLSTCRSALGPNEGELLKLAGRRAEEYAGKQPLADILGEIQAAKEGATIPDTSEPSTGKERWNEARESATAIAVEHHFRQAERHAKAKQKHDVNLEARKAVNCQLANIAHRKGLNHRSQKDIEESLQSLISDTAGTNLGDNLAMAAAGFREMTDRRNNEPEDTIRAGRILLDLAEQAANR